MMYVVEWCLRGNTATKAWVSSAPGGLYCMPTATMRVSLFWHPRSASRLPHIIVIESKAMLKKYAKVEPHDRYAFFSRGPYYEVERLVPQVQRMMESGGWT